jgi:hypothetical protein
MAWVWFGFVLFVLLLIAVLQTDVSTVKQLRIIKAILEDETNSPEGKVASLKIFVNNTLE